MEITLKSEGLNAVIEQLKRFENYGKLMDPILRETAVLLTTYAKERIISATNPDDSPYQPLADSTMDRLESNKKLKPPYPILRRSGNMVRGFFSKVEPLVINIGDTMHYFVYHQGNGPRTKIPRRAALPFTDDLRMETKGSGGKFWKDFTNKLLALVK